jgi:hypothetical protein
LALWNCEGGDVPDGSEDMIAQARALGDEPEIIDPKTFRGL